MLLQIFLIIILLEKLWFIKILWFNIYSVFSVHLYVHLRLDHKTFTSIHINSLLEKARKDNKRQKINIHKE